MIYIYITGRFNYGMATSLGEGNSEFKTIKKGAFGSSSTKADNFILLISLQNLLF